MNENRTDSRVIWRLTGILLLAAVPAVGAAQVPMLPDFAIEDQFGTVHERAGLEGSAVLVVASGRGGREENAAWGAAMREALAQEIADRRLRILPVADVRGVPGFLEGRVRGGFPEDPERWILLDWDGRFAEAFDLDGDETTVLLFSPDGRLLSRTAEGAPDAVRVRMMAALARDALGAAPPSR